MTCAEARRVEMRLAKGDVCPRRANFQNVPCKLSWEPPARKAVGAAALCQNDTVMSDQLRRCKCRRPVCSR
jgi:hypothetical protein